ncbi:MAG: ABC transporter substrate-binding protein [Proteobacteria bacterium]|nr:MAG: ABC transporter substrate-binding protein [Pseudomonadota bacterium]
MPYWSPPRIAAHRVAALTLIGLLWPVLPAPAQGNFPSRPVQFVVPYSAGGGTDIITRVMSERLQADLKQPFPVENKPGAGGSVGGSYVANSAPDGYTILMGSPGPLITNQFLYSTTPYDPARAFAPVILVARLPNVLVVHPSLGVKSTQELIDKARLNSGLINFASGGTGTSGHLSMELFKAMSGTNLSHVPYKGTGQALQDVVAGRVPVLFDNVTPLLPHIQAGTLLALGVSTRNPIASLPNTSPVADAVAGFEASSWVAIVAPGRVPPTIIERLNVSANQILKDPVVSQRLQAVGATPAGGSSDELGSFLVEETAKWKKVIDLAGIAATAQ